MDLWKKLFVLGVHSRYDVCSRWESYENNVSIPGIYVARSRSGSVPILKLLFTNECLNNCNFCANRKDRDKFPRVSFDVYELVNLTENLFGKGLIKGIFLSSAVGNDPEDTFLRMGEVVRLLRERGVNGYIHLKILPGVSFDLVNAYIKYASRVSYNFEVPTGSLNKRLCVSKNFSWGLKLINQLDSFTTQFVVDYGYDKSDRDYLKFIDFLNKKGLKRAYFKVFEPVVDTPMENIPSGNKLREYRLYQAEFLIRCYGFSYNELLDGDVLRLDVDPKLFAALKNMDLFPVDLKYADKRILLKVPGIGPKTANLLVKNRRYMNRLSVARLLPRFELTRKFVVWDGKPLEGRYANKTGMLPLFARADITGSIYSRNF